MRQQVLRLCVLAVVMTAPAACNAVQSEAPPPDLAQRGTTMTTTKPKRQDLTNRVSLSGKVTLNPIFGLVAPIDGEVRYLTVKSTTGTPTKPTKVANIWVKGKATKSVEVPAGATFAGRLVDDRSKVTAGTPVVSAKFAGYGVVADIDGAQAYKISDALTSVTVQIKNGPGPFACSPLGTIAALPPGTVPEPPPAAPQQGAQSAPAQGPPILPPAANGGSNGDGEESDATGMRVVCIPAAGTKLINGVSATLEVITEKATNVMVLPVEAVAGGQGQGKVDVVDANGNRQTRDVVLGLTDGKVIEIKSGLTGDETVAVPGPNLPAPKQGPENGPGFSK